MASFAQQSVSTVARLACDAATARKLADALSESYGSGEAVVAAFEDAAGGWSVEVHFAQAPDPAALRDVVATIAGPAAARALVVETVAARDWVAASLAGLRPVSAGRFLVHGAHDRAGVPAHRVGIEVEAALAFGTGHHGTTRGCLLALDARSEEHTSELQSQSNLVCRLLLEKKKKKIELLRLDPHKHLTRITQLVR